jgi:PAS domain S-box-containing protein
VTHNSPGYEERTRTQPLRRILSEPDFFRLVFDALPLQVVVKSTRPENFGKFLLWNRVAEDWLGLKADQVLGRTDFDLFPPEQAEFFQAKDREVVEARETIEIDQEVVLSRSRGERILHTIKTPIFDDNGRPIALLAVSDDITERLAAEAERARAAELLHESEERWQLALAGTAAGVWDWKIRSGEMFFSDHWRDLVGCTEADVPRTPDDVLALVHPDDRAIVRERTLALLHGRSDLLRCEYRLRRVDGSYIWILAHAKAQFGMDGRPERLIGTLIDITERRRVEEQLLDAKEIAEEANRAKSDFLAMMSHEIRTPLNGVLGFAELLASTPLDERQAEYLETLRESGANLMLVLNDILDYSKMESGKLSFESRASVLREVVRAAVETFRARADSKGLALDLEIAPDVPAVVLVDPVRLRQILSNLISNAVKFTSMGGVKVQVDAEVSSSEAGAPIVRFQVSDSGIGIPEEAIPRLFQPFQQLDISMARRFGGTGLGLTIVDRLSRMMGGGVSVTSSVGRGTTFLVQLPLPRIVTPSTAEISDHKQPESPVQITSLSILVVEDNVVNRRLTSLMLKKLGLNPDEAEDGLRAIALAAKRQYDVILMDIQMPGMDGYEAARHIQRIRPKARIVALTAHAMESDRRRSAELGMQAHLTKPIRLDDLRTALAEAARSSQNPGPV